MTTSLILGVAGGEGAYLSRLLQARGHQVWATTPNPATDDLAALDDLGVRADIKLLELRSGGDLPVLLADMRADEIYDLRPTFGGDPEGLAEDCRRVLGALPASTRAFIAGSGEAYGDTGGVAATESTRFAPATDAGTATAAIVGLVEQARGDGRFAVTGLQFDHASRFGPRGGRAMEIIAAVHAISSGETDTLELDDADDELDWGWTPEYVDAMRRMLAANEPHDRIIATGTRLSVRAFAGHALDYFRVDGERLVTDPLHTRAIRTRLGDPAAINRDTGWRAYTHGRDLVDTLCEGYAAGIGAA